RDGEGEGQGGWVGGGGVGRGDGSGQIAGEIELWTLGKGPFGRGAEWPPGGQCVQEGGTAGGQKADFHFQMWARDQRILAAPILDRSERQCTRIHSPDRHNWVRRANDLVRCMQLESRT